MRGGWSEAERQQERKALKRDTDSSRSRAVAIDEPDVPKSRTGATPPSVSISGAIPASSGATVSAASASSAVSGASSSSGVANAAPPQRKLWVAAVVALVLVAGAAAGYYFLHRAPNTIESIAVLPLTNGTSNSEMA